MKTTFQIGITPDFYTDAKGRFELAVASSFGGRDRIAWEPMAQQPNKTATPEALNQFDAILSLGLKVNTASLTGVERLTLIARWGVGYDMIDVDALTAADVALAITPGAVRRPVAEAILTLVFALATNLVEQDKLVRQGKWRGDLPRLGRNIAGRTLGSVGCGNIAREMFRMTASLGFGRLIASDPFVSPAEAAEAGVELVSMEEVLRSSDFVTINTLLNSSTRGLIGPEQLRLMKSSAYLINTSRGGVIQESALIAALQERRIAGAGLDVFEIEPLPASSPLRHMDNVVLTPHGLAWTEESVRDNGLEACANILTVFRGEVPQTIVNKDVLARPGFQQKLARYRTNL